MVLSGDVWRELGMLDGHETCVLCRERPLVLLDVARAPILLGAAYARHVIRQLGSDLEQLATGSAVG